MQLGLLAAVVGDPAASLAATSTLGGACQYLTWHCLVPAALLLTLHESIWVCVHLPGL